MPAASSSTPPLSTIRQAAPRILPSLHPPRPRRPRRYQQLHPSKNNLASRRRLNSPAPICRLFGPGLPSGAKVLRNSSALGLQASPDCHDSRRVVSNHVGALSGDPSSTLYGPVGPLRHAQPLHQFAKTSGKEILSSLPVFGGASPPPNTGGSPGYGSHAFRSPSRRETREASPHRRCGLLNRRQTFKRRRRGKDLHRQRQSAWSPLDFPASLAAWRRGGGHSGEVRTTRARKSGLL